MKGCIASEVLIKASFIKKKSSRPQRSTLHRTPNHFSLRHFPVQAQVKEKENKGIIVITSHHISFLILKLLLSRARLSPWTKLLVPTLSQSGAWKTGTGRLHGRPHQAGARRLSPRGICRRPPPNARVWTKSPAPTAQRASPSRRLASRSIAALQPYRSRGTATASLSRVSVRRSGWGSAEPSVAGVVWCGVVKTCSAAGAWGHGRHWRAGACDRPGRLGGLFACSSCYGSWTKWKFPW